MFDELQPQMTGASWNSNPRNVTLIIGNDGFRASIVVQTLDRQFAEHNEFALFEGLMCAAKPWYCGVQGGCF